MTNESFDELYYTYIYNSMTNGSPLEWGCLFRYLNGVIFASGNVYDRNRISDSCLRKKRWIEDTFGVTAELQDTCTILELIFALASTIEEEVMVDSDVGDRTALWFWKMIVNLGLSKMDDRVFDPIVAGTAVTRFLSRGYSQDGKGGLFYVKNAKIDMREADLWYQACVFMQDFIEENRNTD